MLSSFSSLYITKTKLIRVFFESKSYETQGGLCRQVNLKLENRQYNDQHVHIIKAEVTGLDRCKSLRNNFTNFCALNGLVIGGSIFAPKRKNKVTWVSPDNSTENQIGHICINKKFRRFLQDVRARRGAGVASDHHLVITRVKLKLKRNSSVTTRRQRCNVNLLRENENEQRTRTDFTIRSKFIQNWKERVTYP